MSSFFNFSVQRLARDVTEVVEIREEVTRARAAAIMAGARATRAERIT
jgi:hypothetical protein